VNPISDVSEVPGLIEDKSTHIHTVGVELDEERKTKMISKFKEYGVTRITQIREMYKPSIFDYKLF
jgi:pheromone shutdown protein TraB